MLKHFSGEVRTVHMCACAVRCGAVRCGAVRCGVSYAWHVVMRHEFLRGILKNPEMSNFIKIRSVGAEWRGRQTDRQADRQTDRQTDR